MSTSLSTKENNKAMVPSPSPENPRADLLGIVRQIVAMDEANQAELRDVERLSDELFSVLIDHTDEQVFGGEVQLPKDSSEETRQRLQPYINSLNKLLPLAREPETGALRQLTPEVVKSALGQKGRQAYGLAEASGGNPYLKFVCNVANEEAKWRIPDIHTKVTAVSSLAGPQNKSHSSHSAAPAA